MLTLLLYVLIVGLVAALLFLVASAVFGRGEELGPLPEGTTVTVLPAAGIRGSDVRALRFQQVFRGYKAGEVDWALSRLAARIDELEMQLERSRSTYPSAAGEPEITPAQPNTGTTLPPTDTPPAAGNATTTNFSTGTFFGGATFAGPGSATFAGPGSATFAGPGSANPNGLGGPAPAGPGTPAVGGATGQIPADSSGSGFTLGASSTSSTGSAPGAGFTPGAGSTPAAGFTPGAGPTPGAGLTPGAGFTSGAGFAPGVGFGSLPAGAGMPTGTALPGTGYPVNGYAPAIGTALTVAGPHAATPTGSTVGEPGSIGQAPGTVGVASPTDAAAQAAASGSVEQGTTPQASAGHDGVAPTDRSTTVRPESETTSEAGVAGTTGYIAPPGPDSTTGFAPATETPATGWAPPPLPGDPPSAAGGPR